MIFPSVASCDFARTHPLFLASICSFKNIKKSFQQVIDFIHDIFYKRVIFDPRSPKTPLDLYFLSEILVLDFSHSRRTHIDFYRICGCSASTLFYIIQLCEIPCETFRIFGGPMSTSIAFAHDPFPICLTIFSFSNIPCGTFHILEGPI